MTENQKTQIVKRESAGGRFRKGGGYNYASLADIVKAGFEIPKMRIAHLDGSDFVEYFDGENWQMGARVVVPAMEGMNESQQYGSALTYARRYTVQLALGLAADDDEKIENTPPAAPTMTVAGGRLDNGRHGYISFDEIRAELDELTTKAEVEGYWKTISPRLTDRQKVVIRRDVDRRMMGMS